MLGLRELIKGFELGDLTTRTIHLQSGSSLISTFTNPFQMDVEAGVRPRSVLVGLVVRDDRDEDGVTSGQL